MNKNDLREAIGDIDEKFISEAALYKRKSKAAVWIASAVTAAACVVGAFFGITALNNRPVIADKVTTLMTLKVGKYYLNGGTDEQYIEVYDDETICLFGFVPDPDASDVQLEELKQFTTRRYYALNEKVPFIALNDEPNGRTDGVGYGYNGSEIISFTAVINGEFVPLEYVYRAE